MEKLAIIINYCSNERMFLNTLLKNACNITDTIVVSYGNKTYDGVDDNVAHLNYYQRIYPTVKFVQYNVDLTLDIQHMRGVIHRRLAYYHNLARYTAVLNLDSHVQWVLVLDADEIADASRFKQWFMSMTLDDNTAYKLATYWFFKEVIFRAKTTEDSILLIHKKYLTEQNIFHDNERDDLIQYSKCKLIRDVKGIDGKPMFNHYSWIRGKEGLRKKLNSWAHKDELFPNNTTDEIVDYIYKDNNVNDIVHNYEYDIVENNL